MVDGDPVCLMGIVAVGGPLLAWMLYLVPATWLLFHALMEVE